ncbi:uncharacterized protein LOC103949860 isoform X1 [Pyrus x bretschneideri]|uniref:uncharacterized protein LOC103949860 isoform X1 n=1 Tax=Pyrus x bretschneideri TaxID=225117 RepID=UPI00203057CE|nr:uncharacterized protein LOC103949860 isoform X1 [Pyrus x bretschneideri]XP_048440689.1 uncharacterized protein LOC103949860 isoform X1 [Pyrus x bretschneideri]XP_048440690.1 uncharacterized protein LOC103949860 isoform X1 [Pyrus x bretschneideri]
MQQLSIIKFMIRQMVLAVVVLIMLGNQKKETLVFEFCSYMSRCKRRLCSCVPVNCNFITFSVQIFLIPTIDFITALIFHTTTLCCFRKISVSIVFEIVFWACLNLNDATFDLSNGRVVDEFPCSYSGVVIFLSLLYFKTTLTSSSPASSCSPGNSFVQQGNTSSQPTQSHKTFTALKNIICSITLVLC